MLEYKVAQLSHKVAKADLFKNAIFHNSPKSHKTVSLFLLENLLPSSFKTGPICSHWFAGPIFATCPRIYCRVI